MSLTNKALFIIERNLGSDLTLAGIAKNCAVSRFHLAHAFGESTGRTVMDYVRAGDSLKPLMRWRPVRPTFSMSHRKQATLLTKRSPAPSRRNSTRRPKVSGKRNPRPVSPLSMPSVTWSSNA